MSCPRGEQRAAGPRYEIEFIDWMLLAIEAGRGWAGSGGGAGRGRGISQCSGADCYSPPTLADHLQCGAVHVSRQGV